MPTPPLNGCDAAINFNLLSPPLLSHSGFLSVSILLQTIYASLPFSCVCFCYSFFEFVWDACHHWDELNMWPWPPEWCLLTELQCHQFSCWTPVWDPRLRERMRRKLPRRKQASRSILRLTLDEVVLVVIIVISTNPHTNSNWAEVTCRWLYVTQSISQSAPIGFHLWGSQTPLIIWWNYKSCKGSSLHPEWGSLCTQVKNTFSRCHSFVLPWVLRF